MSFRLNDIIRKKKPCFGESVWKIVGLDANQFYAVQGPGKYGSEDDPKYRQIIFKSEMGNYRFAIISETIYLYILGRIYDIGYYIKEKLCYH